MDNDLLITFRRPVCFVCVGELVKLSSSVGRVTVSGLVSPDRVRRLVLVVKRVHVSSRSPVLVRKVVPDGTYFRAAIPWETFVILVHPQCAGHVEGEGVRGSIENLAVVVFNARRGLIRRVYVGTSSPIYQVFPKGDHRLVTCGHGALVGETTGQRVLSCVWHEWVEVVFVQCNVLISRRPPESSGFR